MALKDQLQEELKQAMRDGNNVKRDSLRSVLTAISNAEIARVNVKNESSTRESLGDPEVLDVIQKQAKQRRESIEEFTKGGRTDLVAKEESELAILVAYLPAQLDREAVVAAVRAVMDEVGASGPADKPKVMPKAIARLKGQADGRVINDVVTELLGK